MGSVMPVLSPSIRGDWQPTKESRWELSKTRVPYIQDQLVVTVEMTHWDSEEIQVTIDQVIAGELMGTLTCDWIPCNFTEGQEAALRSAVGNLLSQTLTRFRSDMKMSGQLAVEWPSPAGEGESV